MGHWESISLILPTITIILVIWLLLLLFKKSNSNKTVDHDIECDDDDVFCNSDNQSVTPGEDIEQQWLNFEAWRRDRDLRDLLK